MKLWRNDEFRDRSIEINGRIYEHVPDEGLTELVEGAIFPSFRQRCNRS
jgi:hypothetical protein